MGVKMGEPDSTLPIRDIINKVISGLTTDSSKKERLTEERIEELWREAAGTAAGRGSRPVSLRKGKLLVNVGDSSLLYDMTLRKKQILEGLIQSPELKDRLKEIQFRIGEISGKESAKDKSRGPKG